MPSNNVLWMILCCTVHSWLAVLFRCEWIMLPCFCFSHSTKLCSEYVRRCVPHEIWVFHSSVGEYLKSSVMWHSVIGGVVTDILGNCSAFIFRAKNSKKKTSWLKIKALWSIEMSRGTHPTTWHCIPDNLNLLSSQCCMTRIVSLL